MQLFQRVEIVLSLFKMPKYVLAENLGIKQNTLGRYFCIEHQDKLKQHLWEIAELFPTISRNWLFFEDGEMMAADENVASDTVAKLKHELEQERALNKKLQTKIFMEGTISQDYVDDTGRAAGQE